MIQDAHKAVPFALAINTEFSFGSCNKHRVLSLFLSRQTGRTWLRGSKSCRDRGAPTSNTVKVTMRSGGVVLVGGGGFIRIQ